MTCSAATRGADAAARSAVPPGAPSLADSAAASPAASSAITPLSALLSDEAPPSAAALHPVTARAAASRAPARAGPVRTDRRVRMRESPSCRHG